MTDIPHIEFPTPSGCLTPLTYQPRWVGWRYEPRKGGGKPTKVPYQIDGRPAKGSDPNTWATFYQVAQERERHRFQGAGLQLLGLKGFAAFDLDNVIDEGGRALPWADKLIQQAGSYAEITPSKRGIRILGLVPDTFLPVHRKWAHPAGGEVEIYANVNTGRYITVSGARIDDTPDELARIERLIEEMRAQFEPPELFIPEPEAPREFQQRQSPPHGFGALPYDLQSLIATPAAIGTRSGRFQSAVNGLQARGMSMEDAFRLFSDHPSGPASKYLEENRLPAELRRAWGKAQESLVRSDTRQAPPQTPSLKPPPARTSKFFSAAELHDKPVPVRNWLIPEMIPGDTVTLLSGDGGTGKSLIALQLACSVARGESWLRFPVKHGRALFMTAEDSQDELHIRLDGIGRAEGFHLSELRNLTIRSLAGEDATLAVPDNKTVLGFTALYDEIKSKIEETRPVLCVLDTSADLFGGDENNRAEVRQFVSSLRGLALQHSCAVVLLSHPSLTGMNSGSGISGSTAWNNSVRSRLYLTRCYEGDGPQKFEPNTRARALKVMKQNYAETGGEIRLEYCLGAFNNVSPIQEGTAQTDRAAFAEARFLDLLREFLNQGRIVSPAVSHNFGAKLFAGHHGSGGLSKNDFQKAMERLLSQGRIVVRTEGPPSRAKQVLAFPDVEEVSQEEGVQSEVQSPSV